MYLLVTVRGEVQVISLRESRYLHELCNATKDQSVRLEDVHGPYIDHVPEAVARVFVLARCDRNASGPGDLGLTDVVVRLDRLLEPEQIVLLGLSSEFDRLIVAISIVGVDHQPDIRPDRFTRYTHTLHIGVDR